MTDQDYRQLVIGDWLIEPKLGRISRDGDEQTLEPRLMDVLVYLARRKGEVISGEQIIDDLWDGVVVTGDSVYHAISKLRKALGDEKSRPTYIETISKRGYRLIAAVRLMDGEEISPAPGGPPGAVTGQRRIGRPTQMLVGVLALVLAITVYRLAQPPVLEPALEIAERSIAVMPFMDLSPNGDQEYFSDGISEELLNALSRVKGLRVAGRTSSFSFKGREPSVQEIGRALGVAAILEGSVRTEDGRVRIAAQLIDTRDGFHIWSEVYEQDLSSVFSIQDEIAGQVTEALKMELLGQAGEPIAASRTDVGIYEDYLRARAQERQGTIAGLIEAEEIALTVIEQDPSFAPAQALTADIYIQMGMQGMFPFMEGRERARPYAEEAVRLDPNLIEGWLALARCCAYDGGMPAQGEGEAATSYLARAEAINPYHPALFLRRLGPLVRDRNFQQLEEEIALAELVDPRSYEIRTYITDAYQFLGRHEEAMEAFDKELAIRSHPTRWAFSGHLAMYGLGDWVDGLDRVLRAAARDPDDPEVPALLSGAYLDLGAVAEAEAAYARAEAMGSELTTVSQAGMLLHVYRGEWKDAVRIARDMPHEGPKIRPWGRLSLVAAVLGADDLENGRTDEAIARYEMFFPRFSKTPVTIYSARLWYVLPAATALAALYQSVGEQEKADRLIVAAETEIDHWHRLGDYRGYGIADVEVLALKGEKQAALQKLRQAAEEGWRRLWWFRLDYHPALASIRDTPEFAAIRSEFEARVAADRLKVRAAVAAIE